MSPLERESAETHVLRILQERAARLTLGIEALSREMAQPISLLPLLEAGGKGQGPSSSSPDQAYLNAAVKGLARAEDQIALLDRLLEGASQCFSRACLFLVRGATAQGWSSVGLPEGEGGDPARKLLVPLGQASLLKAALDSCTPAQTDKPSLSTPMFPAPAPGQRIPRRAVAAPILVRNRVSAILYGDDGGDGRSICDFLAAEILAGVASLAAENLALRARPEAPETLAQADVEIRIPPVEDTIEAAPAADPPEADSIEEELEYASFAREGSTEPAGLAPEEARLHDEARRFARLLVSELLLYNEDVVIAGRRQRDIFQRLREEIDKSRQAYLQRVSPKVRGRADYFQEELVRTLAQGDPLALGME